MGEIQKELQNSIQKTNDIEQKTQNLEQKVETIVKDSQKIEAMMEYRAMQTHL